MVPKRINNLDSKADKHRKYITVKISTASYKAIKGSVHTQTATLNVKLTLILKTHPLTL